MCPGMTPITFQIGVTLVSTKGVIGKTEYGTSDEMNCTMVDELYGPVLALYFLQ